jgi:hypothetical protein
VNGAYLAETISANLLFRCCVTQYSTYEKEIKLPSCGGLIFGVFPGSGCLLGGESGTVGIIYPENTAITPRKGLAPHVYSLLCVDIPVAE